MFQITEADRYQRVSPSGLALCRTPKAEDIGASRRWAALPHRAMWADMIERLAASGHALVDSPEVFVSPDGRSVLGGLHFNDGSGYNVRLPDGRTHRGHVRHALAFRNDNGGNASFSVAAGASVWVCANGCISGTERVSRRHLVGLDWRGVLADFVSGLRGSFERQAATIQLMADTPLSDDQAAHWLIERRRTARLPAHVLDKAWQHWRKPPHEEFTGRNRWSLYNAVTEAAKGSSLRSQARALVLS